MGLYNDPLLQVAIDKLDNALQKAYDASSDRKLSYIIDPFPLGGEVRKNFAKQFWQRRRKGHLVFLSISPEEVCNDQPETITLWKAQFWKDVFGVDGLSEQDIQNLVQCEKIVDRTRFFVCMYNDAMNCFEHSKFNAKTVGNLLKQFECEIIQSIGQNVDIYWHVVIFFKGCLRPSIHFPKVTSLFESIGHFAQPECVSVFPIGEAVTHSYQLAIHYLACIAKTNDETRQAIKELAKEEESIFQRIVVNCLADHFDNDDMRTTLPLNAYIKGRPEVKGKTVTADNLYLLAKQEDKLHSLIVSAIEIKGKGDAFLKHLLQEVKA
jgi:hypothetical protein